MSHWQPYSPTSNQPWDLRRVAHLHRRAVFGASWAELQRDLSEGPQDAVGRVLAGRSRMGVSPEFERLAGLIGDAAASQPNANRLKAWWIYRFLFSPDPLRERLTLMWHNHFATSNQKVNNLRRMKRQNDTFHQHATGRFGELLQAMLRDPALLVWLDAPANRRGHPNENLGRELMELFTLGIGNYSEADVKEAARALTGLRVDQHDSQFDLARHDRGTKTILGQTEDFDPQRLVNLLLKHPATADRLAWRLVQEFFSEGVVSSAAVQELAKTLRDSQLDIGGAVEVLLRSELFFSAANINSRICDPVTYLVAPLRSLELCDRPPSTLWLSDWLTRMGQDLFYPPNVAGWPGGRHWLTTRTIIARANYAAAVAAGEIYRPHRAPAFSALSGKPADLDQRARMLLLGRSDDDASGSTDGGESVASLSPKAKLVFRMLTDPDAHLH
ncbi:MAG: DUF1800 domain-containing protein [Pirellulales bacterium]|nr:DUF1800 domain-containing protein [Pirellulales bacterium]